MFQKLRSKLLNKGINWWFYTVYPVLVGSAAIISIYSLTGVLSGESLILAISQNFVAFATVLSSTDLAIRSTSEGYHTSPSLTVSVVSAIVWSVSYVVDTFHSERLWYLFTISSLLMVLSILLFYLNKNSLNAFNGDPYSNHQKGLEDGESERSKSLESVNNSTMRMGVKI